MRRKTQGFSWSGRGAARFAISLALGVTSACVLVEAPESERDPAGVDPPQDDPDNWPTIPPGPSMPADGGPMDDGGPMGDTSGSGDPMDDDPMDGSNFLEDPDGGGTNWECDLYEQDCSAGEKCMPWASDGGAAINATRCVEVVPEPAGKGEPCRYEGQALSGLDDCGHGMVCWDLDPEGDGVCVALCTGTDSNPGCDDPNDVCVGKEFMLCFPRCSPLDDNCPVGCGCYPTGDDFGCFPDASGEMGVQGDACEFLNTCDSGLACVGASGVADCPAGSNGCCTAFCDMGLADCPAPHECVPWFEPAEAPPWYEDLGACILMP